MDNIILSVVIPSYNSEQYIEECLKSLAAEKLDNTEYILVDGGSIDRTMDVVDKYRDMFHMIISEPDKGQSDAFNKGFLKARGEYLTWLNSDDVFCPGALKKVVQWIKKEKKPWYAANLVYINETSQIIRCCQSAGFEKWALRFGILNVFGPSSIFHRNLYSKLGPFREDFHYCMDTEYWWRMARNDFQYERIPYYLWALRLHDKAKTAKCVLKNHYPPRMLEEGNLIHKKYYPSASKLITKMGRVLVRIWRIFNCSYIISGIDTLKNRDRYIKNIKCSSQEAV